jgi:hypothetical protein
VTASSQSVAYEPRAEGASLKLFLLWVVGALYLMIALFGWRDELGFDSHAYWLAWHHTPMYGVQPNQQDAYLYSPAFAQMIWPLAQLPWNVFLAVWTLAGAAIYVWLLWPLGRWAVPLLLFCVPQVAVGNIWPGLALLLVFAFRRPSLWSAALLTKPTCGMGIVWFACRREWRQLWVAVATTIALVAVSVFVSPHLWLDWLHLLAGGGTAGHPAGAVNIPIIYRLPMALSLAVYAARRSRPALLVAAVGLGAPLFPLSFLLSNVMVFTALPRLSAQGTGSSQRSTPAAA